MSVTLRAGRRRRCSRAWHRRGRARAVVVVMLLDLSRASIIGQGNIKGVYVKSEILQRVRVSRSLGRVVNGELEAVLVVVGVVLHDALAHAGHVEEAVDQIRRKVEAQRALRDSIAVPAHAIESLARLVGERADDGFFGRVLSAPVAAPAIQCTISIRVVATEFVSTTITVYELLEPSREISVCLESRAACNIPSDDLSGWSVAKVLLVNLGAVTEAEDMITGVGRKNGSFVKPAL